MAPSPLCDVLERRTEAEAGDEVGIETERCPGERSNASVVALRSSRDA